MITLYPGFRFGLIRGVMSASFAFSRGVSPSVCTITLPSEAEKFLDRKPKPMIWTDGSRTVTFRDCIVNDSANTIGDDGFVTLVVAILDRRWKWKYSQISGRYNVRSGGVIIKETKKSVRELVELCLKELGETNYDIKQLPNDQYPHVDWDLLPINSALDQLCQLINCHVALTEKDKVIVYPEGFGRELPNLPNSSRGVAVNFGAMPGKVGVASAPAKWQLDFDLVPVGLDTDGEIRPIWELSYMPVSERTIDGNKVIRTNWQRDWEPFLNVDRFARKFAQATIWRWYLIVPPDWSVSTDEGRKLKIERGSQGMKYLPGVEDKLEIKSARQFFPLLDHQLEYDRLPITDAIKVQLGTLDDKMRVRKPAQVFGYFYDEQGRGSDNWYQDTYDNSDIHDKGEHLISTKSFTIDHDRGILIFADPMYRLKKGERVAPDIRLRVAANFHHHETRAGYRVFKTFDIKGASDPKLIAWNSREDAVLEIIARHDEDKGKTEFKSDDTNKDEVDKRLEYYLSCIAKKYEVRTPAQARYPMLVPYSPDGLIAQVIYEIGGNGQLFTSVHKEREEVSNLPTYDERRQALQLKTTLDMVAKQQGGQSDKKDGK